MAKKKPMVDAHGEKKIVTNKSDRTSPFMKVVIAIFAFILVITMMLPSLSAFFSGDKSQGGQVEQSQTDGSNPDDDSPNDARDVDALFTPAIDALNKRLEKDPENVAMLNDLAQAYYNWGVQLLPYSEESEANKNHMESIFAKATEAYDKILVLSPSDSVEIDRALSLFYAGKTEEAINDVKAITERSPEYGPAWANLGMLYEADKKVDEARDAYTKALEVVDEEESPMIKPYIEGRLEVLNLMDESKAASDSSETSAEGN
ncbi:MAG: tetratricopeptide repeat protein [Coriobacteriia bacterium]|nr:tetratricopeptide repeat protein [Coriobacteriia bacterium]